MRHRTVLLLLSVLPLAAFAREDTTLRKLHIGWEQGVSARFFPRRTLGVGLVISPAGFSPLYSSRHSESHEENAQQIRDSKESSEGKGATVVVEGLYRLRIGKWFVLTPFVSVGGEYSRHVSDRWNRTREKGAEDSTGESVSLASDRISREFVGRIGLMPGVRIGRVTAQFRLGIRGGVSLAETPDNDMRRQQMNSRYIRLIYPRDPIRETAVHFAIR